MEIVTFWVAVWGAILSTILGTIKIFEFWRSNARVKVKVAFSYPLYGNSISKELQLTITAINKGGKIIILEGAGLTLSDKFTIPFINDNFGNRFPQDLKVNDSSSVHFNITALKEAMKPTPSKKIIKAWFRDKTGKNHYCKIHKDITSL